MKAIFVIFIISGLVGCVAASPNRSLSGGPSDYIQVNDNLKYTIKKRPNGSAILATYNEYTFMPPNLSELEADCIEMGYDLADMISNENDGLLQMIDGTLFVKAKRRGSGDNSCTINFRLGMK